MELGAFDYITKSFELEKISHTIKRAFEYQDLSQEVEVLRDEISSLVQTERIVGNSAAMQEVYKVVGKVAKADATVLITGESGTGKELVAEALHYNSNRRSGPIVKVSCAALPETLLEAELFGHEKGSFTGAMTQRRGRFEMADKGTIFLDEIGEMSLPMQTKLLRVLQERKIERVGSSLPIKVDIRIICASSRSSAMTCFTGSTSSISTCRRFAIAKRTYPRSSSTSSRSTVTARPRNRPRSARKRSSASWSTTGRATCVSSRTSSSARSCFLAGRSSRAVSCLSAITRPASMKKKAVTRSPSRSPSSRNPSPSSRRTSS